MERMVWVQTADGLDAAGLWWALFGGETGYLCVSSGKRTEASKLQEFGDTFFRYPEQAGEAAAWVAERSGNGFETYFCVHLLTKPQRRSNNAAPVWALWADMDHGVLVEGNGDISGGLPAPSVTVESSPGRTQAYWCLTRPVEPKVAERLNKRIVLATGADASGYDLTQLLRPPGSREPQVPGRAGGPRPRFRSDRRSLRP